MKFLTVDFSLLRGSACHCNMAGDKRDVERHSRARCLLNTNLDEVKASRFSRCLHSVLLFQIFWEGVMHDWCSLWWLYSRHG